MAQYLIAGLVLGSIYALMSVGLVTTYLASGILNFSFGTTAYAVARIFYYLNSEKHLGILPSAALSIFVAAPGIGLVLWATLFRALRLASTLTKIAATVGLSVTIPAATALIFGNHYIVSAPGLAPQPVHVYRVGSVPITLDQCFVLACTLLIGLVGFLVFRYTSVGLMVRATVDSEAMTSLSGTNPSIVSGGVWVTGSTLAGLVGILLAPILGLDPNEFTLIMAASFGAVIVARFSRIGIAACVALLFGVGTGIADRYLPGSSSLTSAVVVSIPFGFVLVALIYFLLSGFSGSDGDDLGPLDRAIRPSAGLILESGIRGQVPARPGRKESAGAAAQRRGGLRSTLVAVAAIAALIFLLHGLWVGLAAEGVVFALLFLAFTLVTGEGGMVWLCEITFAGLGALFTGQLAGVHGWPVLAAVAVTALVACVAGMAVGALIVRFGTLYIALATLTAGFLIENLVYPLQTFDQFGSGVGVDRPSFAVSSRAFGYLALGLFCVAAVVLALVRRSTAGLVLVAARSGEMGARTMGISVTAVRVFLSGGAAFVAAIGGGMLASYSQRALPAEFATLTGLVWFAVLVTSGVRSTVGAVVAGLSYTIIPGIFVIYLPTSLGQLPPLLFGLGAVLLVRNPDGVVVTHGRMLMSAYLRPKNALVEAYRRHSPRRTELVDAQATGRLDRASTDGRASEYAGSLSVTTREDRESPQVGARRATSTPLLEASGVTVRFGGLAALTDVSISVPPSSIVGLIGPNGAGKTTLFGVLSGVLKPQSGVVRFAGEDISDRSVEYRARRGISRTFQHPQLFTDLTVREHLILADRLKQSRARGRNLSDPIRAMRPRDLAERLRVETLLETLNIASVADRPVGTLSLGLCRLVEVGRALALEPDVVLMDEPSAGLDSGETDRLCSALRMVSADRSVAMLIVEHDLTVALGISEVAYVLDFGRLISTGTPDEIRADPAVIACYLGAEVGPGQR